MKAEKQELEEKVGHSQKTVGDTRDRRALVLPVQRAQLDLPWGEERIEREREEKAQSVDLDSRVAISRATGSSSSVPTLSSGCLLREENTLGLSMAHTR